MRECARLLTDRSCPVSPSGSILRIESSRRRRAVLAPTHRARRPPALHVVVSAAAGCAWRCPHRHGDPLGPSTEPNPPTGFGDPDHGTIVLTSPDTAIYCSEWGQQRQFVRGGGLPPVQGCL